MLRIACMRAHFRVALVRFRTDIPAPASSDIADPNVLFGSVWSELQASRGRKRLACK
jgi:hypothetical protein